MFSRFLKSTLLILVSFSLGAHSSPVDLHRVLYAKQHFTGQSHRATISKSEHSSVIGLLAGQNGAAHLTTQNYRPANFVKQAFVLNYLVFASVTCLKYISRSSQVKYSRFRKLVLFPFHAFW